MTNVDEQWGVVLSHPENEIVRTIAACAAREGVLRKLFPYASLNNLRFSTKTEFPFDVLPYVCSTSESGHYVGRAADNRQIVAGDLDTVVAAVARAVERSLAVNAAAEEDAVAEAALGGTSHDASSGHRVAIALSSDEVLVLFDWLVRQSVREAGAPGDPAEVEVLEVLLAELNRMLPAPLTPDYTSALASARARLVARRQSQFEHDVSELQIDYVGGACPNQAWGTVRGHEFYFRARGQQWTFGIAPAGVDATLASVPPLLFFREESWGEGPYDAGYMPDEEALAIVVRCAREYLELSAPV